MWTALNRPRCQGGAPRSAARTKDLDDGGRVVQRMLRLESEVDEHRLCAQLPVDSERTPREMVEAAVDEVSIRLTAPRAAHQREAMSASPSTASSPKKPRSST